MSHEQDLMFHPNWWWDPIDMEILKILEQSVQRQVIAISLETRAQVMKVQAEGLAKIGNAISAGKQSQR